MVLENLKPYFNLPFWELGLPPSHPSTSFGVWSLEFGGWVVENHKPYFNLPFWELGLLPG